MRSKGLLGLVVFFAVVLFSYGTSSAQIVDKVKDAAGKTKRVTVKAAKKVGEEVEDAASKTKDVSVDTGEAAASKTKSYGNYTVNVTEKAAGQAYEGGKWFVVTTWDGTKWVSKRTWFATKKAASATKEAMDP